MVGYGVPPELNNTTAYQEIVSQLEPREKVLFATRPAKGPYIWSSLFTMIIIVVMVCFFMAIPFTVLFFTGGFEYGFAWYIIMPFGIMMGIVLIIFLINFITSFLRWGSSVYVVTDKRIISQTGSINKMFRECPVDSVISIQIRKPATGFGSGHLIFGTIAGLGSLGLTWNYVKDPEETKKFLDEVVKEQSVPPPPPPGTKRGLPPPPKDDEKFCKECGDPYNLGQKFCENCGNKLL